MHRQELQDVTAALRAALALRARAGVRWVYPGSAPIPAPARAENEERAPDHVRIAREPEPARVTEARRPLPLVAETLEQIRADLGECTRCKLHERRKNVVFGVGSATARLVFVGEGPGADEDEEGEPFVGKAGQLLTKMIEAIGLSRAEVYIANVVKSRPPGNRNPEPDEIAACLPFLERQIAAIKPAILVTLGNVPTKALLKTDVGITKLRGDWKTYKGIPLMPTYHPSFLLRREEENDRDAKREAWNDLQAVAAKYNEDLPPGAKPAKAKSKTS